jgi:hypothetical protein
MFIVQSTLHIGNGMMRAVSGDAATALLLSGADEAVLGAERRMYSAVALLAAVENAAEVAEVVMVSSFSVGDRVHFKSFGCVLIGSISVLIDDVAMIVITHENKEQQRIPVPIQGLTAAVEDEKPTEEEPHYRDNVGDPQSIDVPAIPMIDAPPARVYRPCRERAIRTRRYRL